MTRLLSAAEAAAEVHALIQSLPRSPLPSEIEAVLADMAVYLDLTGTLTQIVCERCLEPPSAVAAKIRDLIPRVQEAHSAACRADTAAMTEGREAEQCPVWQAADAFSNKLSDELNALRKTAWLRAMLHPSLDGLFLLAECAQHHACDWPSAPQPLSEEGVYGQLIMAVLRYGGRSFSVHGEDWDADWEDGEDDEQDESEESQP